jgi:hypothetical protein
MRGREAVCDGEEEGDSLTLSTTLTGHIMPDIDDDDDELT